VDFGYRIGFFGDEIESIDTIELSTGKRISSVENAAIFPANLYLAPKDMLTKVIHEIQDELAAQETYFKSNRKIY
jgi:excinuclease ABC subunit B